MGTLLHGVAALALLFLSGCATRMHLPDAFLELKGNGYRAVTADDARVWVRTFDAPGDGNAEFWSKTLEEELARNRGYKVLKQGNCRDADGHDGRWLECSALADGETMGYLVAVFVLPKGMLHDSSLCVCEFGAREAVFQQHVEAVRTALATLSP